MFEDILFLFEREKRSKKKYSFGVYTHTHTHIYIYILDGAFSIVQDGLTLPRLFLCLFFYVCLCTESIGSIS